MERTAIVLNGPPSSGKDTIAEYLESAYGYERAAFKDVLYQLTAEHFGVDLDELIALATDTKAKEEPWPDPDVTGQSPRGMLIWVSEGVIKPLHGNDYFGKALVRGIEERGSERVVVSDSGFEEELVPLEEWADSCTIIQLEREGCTFANDSRRYVEGRNSWVYRVVNREGFPKTTAEEIISLIEAQEVCVKAPAVSS